MSHNECPHCEDCEIVKVDSDGKESPYDIATHHLEIDSPCYRCKTHGNIFYEWEVIK